MKLRSYGKNRIHNIQRTRGLFFILGAIFLGATLSQPARANSTPTENTIPPGFENYELPTVFISGNKRGYETPKKVPDPPEKKVITEEKKHEQPRYSASLETALGDSGRHRTRGTVRLNLNTLSLTLDADYEDKTKSQRNDRYSFQDIGITTHFQITDALSFSAEYEGHRDDLDLPGPQDSFTSHKRQDSFGNLIVGAERVVGNSLTRLQFSHQREDHDESFNKENGFTHHQGYLLQQWDRFSLKGLIRNDAVNGSFDETIGYVMGGYSQAFAKWAYEVQVGAWDGSRSAPRPIGSAHIEYFAHEISTFRLSLESRRNRLSNGELYRHDNMTQIRDELLPVSHYRKGEFTWMWTQLEELQWALGVFLTSEDNYIYYKYLSTDGLYTPDSIGEVNLAGINFDFHVDIFKPITFDIHYTYSRERSVTGDLTHVPLHPRHEGDITLGYQKGAFQAKLASHLMGERRAFLDDSTMLPTYQIWSLYSEAPLYKWFRWYVDIENLFDKIYERRALYTSEGRIGWFGIRADF